MIAVVVPCFRVKLQILRVLAAVGPEVGAIYVVDDRCPEESGKHVKENCRDPRVKVLLNEANLGVGGAVVTGMRKALADGATIVVKLDGDGQMDPALIRRLIQPILAKRADFAKGNRFYGLETLASMPKVRLFGNSALSFINKVSSGYWNIVDPTNGFVAIHASALSYLPLEKLDRRYFFESDLLFRLNTVRAVVEDVPMKAVYADERSNLRISRVLVEFPQKYLNRMVKRVFYNYFLRDFNVGTIHLLLGLALFLFGFVFGIWKWISVVRAGELASSGTVMLASLPIILGVQFLIAAIQYDVQSVPTQPLQTKG